jgi:2-polyprenyl-3-methyl-5-hydroxy-6-metoxy-1,4-benzoquinol methylase
MGRLKRNLRRILGLYRYSRVLAFIVDYTREAQRLRLNPQQVADEAHLLGAWNFENAVERKWQCHALAAVATQIGKERWGDSLEIGCSEGVFTTELAQRCISVTGYDISPVAIARATERCAVYSNVRIGCLDATSSEILEQYDLVFAMDVLWLVVGRARQSSIAPKLVRALRSGGLLVFSDSRMPKWIRHPFWSLFFPSGADEWAKLLENTPGLTVVHKESYPPDGQSIPGYWEKLFVLFRKNP